MRPYTTLNPNQLYSLDHDKSGKIERDSSTKILAPSQASHFRHSWLNCLNKGLTGLQVEAGRLDPVQDQGQFQDLCLAAIREQ